MPRFFSHPLFLAFCSGFFLLICLGIMVLIYGPVVIVEAKFQYKKVLNDVFHAQDLRSLILPTINTDGIGVNNKEFGMQIPSLYLDEPILFNIDPHSSAEYNEALKKGIAHAAGTDLPAYDGLGYYFAHSANANVRAQYNAVFYLLGKLKEGDDVYIWYEKNRYEYVVTHTEITPPDDVNFLDRGYEKPTIVLQTCWPPGTTQKRLLVFAERKTQESR